MIDVGYDWLPAIYQSFQNRWYAMVEDGDLTILPCWQVYIALHRITYTLHYITYITLHYTSRDTTLCMIYIYNYIYIYTYIHGIALHYITPFHHTINVRCISWHCTGFQTTLHHSSRLFAPALRSRLQSGPCPSSTSQGDQKTSWLIWPEYGVCFYSGQTIHVYIYIYIIYIYIIYYIYYILYIYIIYT